MPPIIPPPLKVNDRVAVTAPAGPVDPQDLESGLGWLRRRYTPIVGEDITSRQGYLAGDNDRRRREIQAALDNPGLRAVLTARGGFGTTDIIDNLNFEGALQTPKWIVGSSDLTALLVHLFAVHHYITIHGPMVAGFHRTAPEDMDALAQLLEGTPWTPPDIETLSGGTARGPLIGGNLTIMAHLAGTLPPAFAEGVILFLEDVGEKPYRLDRCMTQLRRAGILERIAGVVLGEFTACTPGPDGVTALEAVERHLAPLKIPVAMGYPAAHGSRNQPFFHGREVLLQTQGSRVSLQITP